MSPYFKIVLGVAAALLCTLALGWWVLVTQRPMAKFQEETRRQVYQESVTGQTACVANLARIYEDWATAGPEHRVALEALAKAEARRYRCHDLPIEIQTWLGGL